MHIYYYSTYLSRICVEIKMLPLSFFEFIEFHGFELREVKSALGTMKKVVYDKNNVQYNWEEIFEACLRVGGMPALADVGVEQEKVMALLDGIYSTVVRDILEREKRRGQKRITYSFLLKKIALYLADNIGSNISLSNVGNVLANEGLLENSIRHNSPSTHTIQTYVEALLESYLFYDIKRFDIKGKEYLRTLEKYYIVDIGLRNYLLGFRDRDRVHILENIAYFELKCSEYDVAIGKIDNCEIDFIATRLND